MDFLNVLNDILWHDAVLFTVLGVGILFTLWSGFCQYRSLTHGVALIRRGPSGGPGAITHFQALATALSATVGLGNIAGVALAVSLGGPGAVFWMWVTGFVGMALKTTEVVQAMLYRVMDKPDEPRGGAMWVASQGFARLSPALKPVGLVLAGLFCVTLLVSTVTGGNMFQAWNVADITLSYAGIPKMASGAVMTVIVALVILGGIRRIGTVTERLVPFMCGLYLLAGIVVLVHHADRIPGVFHLIFSSAFDPQEAQGAFLGGTAGWAFLKGMQRALFSNEAGQGSSPIAHSAARTEEPVSEGVVAGLEPFVDTLVVCTITALVILSTGIWNRGPDLAFASDVAPVAAGSGRWTLPDTPVTDASDRQIEDGEPVYAIIAAVEPEGGDRAPLQRLRGSLVRGAEGLAIRWQAVATAGPPRLEYAGAWFEYKGATLTARAFDRAYDGLGRFIVPLAVWLFAISTMISWSYYGEQGISYLLGGRGVLPYRIAYCALVFASTTPLIATEEELDVVSSLGTGVMLFVNIPIMLVFGRQAMRAYHDYFRRQRS